MQKVKMTSIGKNNKFQNINYKTQRFKTFASGWGNLLAPVATKSF